MSLPRPQGLVKKYTPQFRQLFGVGKAGAEKTLANIENVKVPQELTRDALKAYRELINRVPDPAGTQKIRAQIPDKLLK